MPEYIEREKAKEHLIGDYAYAAAKMLDDIPAADVVSIGVFEQVKWERDTALKTLEEHGIGLGQKADVVEVVRCKECEHWGGVIFGYRCRHLSGMNTQVQTTENDFCSYGKRKEGAEE